MYDAFCLARGMAVCLSIKKRVKFDDGFIDFRREYLFPEINRGEKKRERDRGRTLSSARRFSDSSHSIVGFETERVFKVYLTCFGGSKRFHAYFHENYFRPSYVSTLTYCAGLSLTARLPPPPPLPPLPLPPADSRNYSLINVNRFRRRDII